MAIVLLLMGFSSHSQSYVEMMHDPTANFYDVQDSFNSYWDGRPMEKGKGYKAFRRWESYMTPRVYPKGNMTLPTQNYANYVEWETNNTNAGIPKSVAGNWTFMGPTGKPAGGGAGRVNFIRFDPVTTTTMYIGAPDGGLWKTTNAGTSWSTNTDQLTVIGCTDLAINPSNTQIMYLATGDGDAGDSYSTGVLKSTDGGTTWAATGLTWTASQGITISRLLINSTNPLILMAFGSNGIWRTTNGGTTWSQPSGTFNGIMDAEFKPGDVNTVYAAGATFRKSTDGGLTWGTAIATGLTGIGRLAIAVTAANPAYVYLLASRGSDSGFLGLVRSTNSGGAFTTRMASTASNNILGWNNGADAGGQGWYDLTIAASPTNAEEIFTGGVNVWRSINGGTSFVLNTHWTGSYSKPQVHSDFHDVVFLPGSGTNLFSGNDGGVFKTTNSGSSWTDVSSNLCIAQQYRVGLSALNATILVTGHQDNGTNKMNGANWTQIYGGDGMDCFIDRTNNNIIYESYVYGDYSKSTNGGGTWTTINTGLPAGDWLCAWHQDPVTATTLYAGGRAALYKTTNSGTAWTALGTPTGTGNIVEFEIAPSNNQIIYALKTGANAVSKSINGGTSFTSVSTGLPTSVMPTDVAISNTNSNIVFVTYSGYGSSSKVFKSINGGTTWTNISTGLPNLPCNTIVYSNGSTNDAIYVGMDVGVYYKDNASGWILFNTGLPNTSVSDLEIYYATNRLRAATFGRGTWDSDLYSAVAAVPVASFTASATTICVGQSVTFTNTSSGIPTSYSWNFAGGTPTTSTATNPTITYNSVGTFAVNLTATNGSGTNTVSQPNYITVVSPIGLPLPLNEGFVSATFAPTNWTIYNADLGDTTWARSSTVGFAPTLGNSMIFDNYAFNDAGNLDEARTPKLNFTGLTSAQMTFDVAYAPYNAANFDGLEVLVSTDCGLTYTSVYSKSNTVLATAPATTALFVPTVAQWRVETISLNAYIGQSSVTIAIRNIAGYGNNIYVDNINITGVAAVGVPVASFTASPSSPICAGQTVTYTSTATNSPTSYSWAFAGGTPATSTSATQVVTYPAAGTYNVSLTATNGSGSNTLNQLAYMTVNAIPSTPGIISGTASVCSGIVGNVYSISAVPGATSYTWTVPAGTTITSGQGTVSAIVTMGSVSGNIAVTATNACGTSSASSLAISINNIPATPGAITGLAAVCSASAGNVYTIIAIPGATNYTWTVPAGATITSGQGTVSATITMGSTSGNVSVTATNACGTSTASSLAITINTTPAVPGSITGSATVCSGSVGNVYSITAVPGATNYTWTVPSGSTITSGQGTVSATITTGSTSGNVSVTATNACGTSSASSLAITINTTPAVPGSITGSATVCSGSGGNIYSITTVPGATSYTWTVPAGATITSGQGTISATVTMGSTTGNVTVAATNACGTSSASIIVVAVTNAPSTPGIISGTTSLCSGSAGNIYSITAVPGATSYAWTVPVGATITSGQGTLSVTVTMGISSGNIAVTASNSCGNSVASSIPITVNSIPSVPGSITGSVIACSGSVGNVYSITPVLGATSYFWTVPAGTIISSGQGSVSATVTMGSTSGNVAVTATNSCGTSLASSSAIVLNSAAPATPGIISGSATPCSGSTGNVYSIAAVSGATNYTWTIPSGATITAGQGTASATVTMGAVAGTISVIASSTCGTSSASNLNITLSTTPTAPGVINGTATVCSGSTQNYSINSVLGATNYTWTSPIGSTITAGQGSSAINTNFGSTAGDITVAASNTCGSSSLSILAINIDIIPSANIPADQNICVGDNTLPIIFSGSNIGSIYSWTNDNTLVGLGASGNGDISSFLSTSNGIANISVTPTLNGCAGIPVSFIINVNQLPIVTLNNFAPVCANWAAFSLTGGSPAGGLYSGATVSSNTFNPITSGPGVFNLTYTVSSNGCIGFASSNITVDACASINETEDDIILIYPNPTNGIVEIEGESLSNYSLVELIDVTGRIVEQWTVYNNKMKINIRNHSTGFYSIKLSGDKGELISRIILN